MVPPPRFDSVRFDTYIPDPNQPSQTEAVRVLDAFAAGLGGAHAAGSGKRRLFGFGKAAAKAPAGPRGVYLDGGYGVGKTHLLASLWHATPAEPALKAFGTFVELTNLVGALGFQQTVQTLSGHRLLCIDEFELDDPGDTVLVSTLLGRLVDAGVALAATSNTLPGKLGEGRFASADFLREIQGLSAHFRPLRIDGEDYRHRGLPEAPAPFSDEQVTKAAYATAGRLARRLPAPARPPRPRPPQPLRRADRRAHGRLPHRRPAGPGPVDGAAARRARRPAVRPRGAGTRLRACPSTGCSARRC